MIKLANLDKPTLARAMDFSILSKETQEAAIRNGCAVTREYGFAAFYTSSPYWTPIVREELCGYPQIEIGTGIAFPFGTVPPSVKAFEVEEAVRRGCTAVDLVMNVGAMKDGHYEVVREELRLFVEAAGNAVTKFILEVCFLDDNEIATACQMAAEAGVHFVKTSTGQYQGPTLEQFMVMQKACKGTGLRLKVAGVKFPRPQNAIMFLLAGAERIGTQAAVEIIEGLETVRYSGILDTINDTTTTRQFLHVDRVAN